MSEVVKLSEAKIEEIDCKDRISALPEELLVTILLHVPIRDAVATMILSKRWRYIWMMLPTLDYNETNEVNHARDWGGDDSDDDLEKKSVWWFLDKSLRLHKAPVLEILLISLGRRCPSDANVGNWVAKAVDRGVTVIQFKLLWSAGPTTLPKSLYTCKTLKELTLSHKILVDFPSSSPACLPSLEILQLSCVVYKDEDSFARFLSSCPVLGKLIVIRKKSDNLTNFIVKVPSLWMLWYYNTTWLLDDYDVVDSGSFLVIDTPALIKFDVTDYSRHSWSIGNMPCLEEAYICVDCLSLFDKIITASSAILSLDLTFQDEMLVRCSTLRFSQLIKLSVDPSGSNWVEPLLLLLGNTPKLEELLVNNESNSEFEDIPLSWNQPSSIPGCLSSHLKIFEWRYYGHKEEEEEFLTYMLANSKCLKTATISLKPMLDSELEQDVIIEKLKGIPRVSTSSQLLVN